MLRERPEINEDNQVPFHREVLLQDPEALLEANQDLTEENRILRKAITRGSHRYPPLHRSILQLLHEISPTLKRNRLLEGQIDGLNAGFAPFVLLAATLQAKVVNLTGRLTIVDLTRRQETGRANRAEDSVRQETARANLAERRIEELNMAYLDMESRTAEAEQLLNLTETDNYQLQQELTNTRIESAGNNDRATMAEAQVIHLQGQLEEKDAELSQLQNEHDQALQREDALITEQGELAGFISEHGSPLAILAERNRLQAAHDQVQRDLADRNKKLEEAQKELRSQGRKIQGFEQDREKRKNGKGSRFHIFS
jgi:chromosome segregation ATPase